ncbi:MAG: COX15/CtaA family protein, partial [Roseicyclus sp.]|uniref:COX15/CtaA family protein n=1 Tax=Roseicyclus sp. TaxID=1914329 RepID=UPI003BAF5977
MAKTRSIFQEVDSAQKPAATPGGVTRDTGLARRLVRAWLMVLFALVVTMVAVGGLTRLTDSGLSITEWAPLSGAVPPMNAQDWQAEFDAYRQIPQYQLMNRGMSLAEFKVIYWWEWGHRQLGRVIGLVWAVGFFGLLASRNIPPGWTGRLLLLGGLGGLQGAIGWWMVHSGLQEGMISVASYRLATHLGLAFLILGLIAWFIMKLGREEAALLAARREGDRKLKGMSTGLLHLSFVQILIGALVAGIDAGRNYIDWPLMAGEFFPPGMWAIEPLWRNLFENDGTVQFIHRMVGYVILALAIGVW